MRRNKGIFYTSRGFTTIQILVVLLFVIGLGFIFFTKSNFSTQVPISEVTSPLSLSSTPVSRKINDSDLPQVKYKFYGGAAHLYNERANSIVSTFVSRSEPLPKSIILDGSTITINKWEIYQVKDGFGAYAYVESNGKEGKIGFSYSEGGVPNPSYSGIVGLEIRKWTDPPTEEERKQGIRGTYHSESINLIGVDYNLSTSEWNFVQLDKVLYTEKLYPIELL